LLLLFYGFGCIPQTHTITITITINGNGGDADLEVSGSIRKTGVVSQLKAGIVATPCIPEDCSGST
jgi:hypothetical protein